MSPKASTPPKSSQSTGGTRDATFTTPVEIRERLRQLARASQNFTVPGIVLAAIEDNLEDLERLVEREKKTEAPSSSNLFPDPTSTTRSSETRVPVTMRLTAANLAVVDALVTKTKADNRSQLLTAALRPYLGAAT